MVGTQPVREFTRAARSGHPQVHVLIRGLKAGDKTGPWPNLQPTLEGGLHRCQAFAGYQRPLAGRDGLRL